MRQIFLLLALTLFTLNIYGQGSRPELPVRHSPDGFYALKGADVWIDYKTQVKKATLVIKNGRVVSCIADGSVPDGAVVLDQTGKTIYPSFIDIYAAGFGIKTNKPEPNSDNKPPKDFSAKPGPYTWNEALKPEYLATTEYAYPEKEMEDMHKTGFGVAIVHRADGISRGAGAVVLLKPGLANETTLNPQFGHFLSFRKGSSTQDYPSSLMGTIALLRQTYLDLNWYQNIGRQTERNLSLEAWLGLAKQAQIFEASDKLDILRIQRLAKEFNQTYLIKTNGDEYQRIKEIKESGATLIVPVNFPEVPKVDDPFLAASTSYETLLHWELATTNLAKLHAAGISFCITSHGLKSRSKFLSNLREAIAQGIPEEAVLKALTITPAAMAGLTNDCGSLAVGQRANFFLSSKPIFAEGAEINMHFIDGKALEINDLDLVLPLDVQGVYALKLGNTAIGQLHITDTKSHILMPDSTKLAVNVKWNDPICKLSFTLDSLKGVWLLEGSLRQISPSGTALSPDGLWANWTAARVSSNAMATEKEKQATKIERIETAVPIPFKPFGSIGAPLQAEQVLVRNATVWTSEKEGVLTDTDVLWAKGKIAQIGKNLTAPQGVTVIDGKGKHLTAGIIDEHSHIAGTRGINEGTQSSSAEVRIGDIIDSEDQDIYRQLAGGVTSSHILHGSANAIGGQTQLIKLRWGLAPEALKMQPWPGFIKFALGENVKQSNWGDNQTSRFPQTRMGVEQVYADYFTRAAEYAALRKSDKPYRRDLELDALAEILDNQRFITCHSYVQSEINMLMRLAEQFKFKVNTFTHILEGYKVADKMAKHGAGGSSFSDWWAYKFEVYQAIPHNAAIMASQGITVAINSDDAEMARRLNQEAAKTVKYGGVSEPEAWKMVTINPAKLLRIDDRVGSIKVGKDADLVLWNDHPLSIYAKPEATWVDGVRYFDLKSDQILRDRLRTDKARLIQKALEKNKKGQGSAQPESSKKHYHCDSDEDEGN
jgi:imidazolonepropionase-like amidohydrolase